MKTIPFHFDLSQLRSIATVLLGISCVSALHADWYKGNTHTHTKNSDGNATPDFVVRWYREHDYNFVVITDHEFLTNVESLNELYGREGQFAVIPGEELTQHLGASRDPSRPYDRPPAHINGINLKQVAVPVGGTVGKIFGYSPPDMTMAETFARNIRAIHAAGGIAQINHPNWRWSVRLDDLTSLPDNTLLEIWNGQFGVNNLGGTDDKGDVALSTEELWDSLLSRGIRIWGVASDDSHNYHNLGEKRDSSNPGRAWVFVKADRLSADDITKALANGNFYSSNGVTLDNFDYKDLTLSITIKSKPQGARYITRFIGKNGKVLAEVHGTNPSYKIKGTDGYVRATITDSDGLKAWTQPVFVTSGN